MGSAETEPPGDPRDRTGHEGDPPEQGIEQLRTLGKALGNETRIRIVAMLVRLGELGPKDVQGATGGDLGSISYHFRYLENLGGLTLTRMLPRRGAVVHKYALTPQLRRAVLAAFAGVESTDAPPAEDASEARAFSREVVAVNALEIVELHSDGLARLGRVLADETLTRVLAYVLRRDSARVSSVAMSVEVKEAAALELLDTLTRARVLRVEGTGAGRQWTVPAATRSALAGLREVVVG